MDKSNVKMAQQVRKMPTKEDILAYWADELIRQHGKFWMDCVYQEHAFVGIKDMNKRILSLHTHTCFACGSDCGTERAHIESKQYGGADDASNLHLLCKECHLESESIENQEHYFLWFKDKSPMNSGSNLRIRNKAKLYESLIKLGRVNELPKFLRDLLSPMSVG